MNTTIRMQSIKFEELNEASEVDSGYHFEELITVKRIVVIASALMMFTLMALGASTAQGSSLPGWGSSVESGISQSRSSDKPLFVLIAKTGCPSCENMERELSRSGNRNALRGAVLVRAESANYPNLTSRYASGGTPTTVIFRPGNYTSPAYSYTGAMDSGTIQQLGRSLDAMAR